MMIRSCGLSSTFKAMPVLRLTLLARCRARRQIRILSDDG
jgi:hypothetical protein